MKEKLIRIQFDMPEEKFKEMENWMAEGGVKTRRDFLNNAISLLVCVMQEKKNGRIIASMDEDQRKIRELHIPILENIASKKECNWYVLYEEEEGDLENKILSAFKKFEEIHSDTNVTRLNIKNSLFSSVRKQFELRKLPAFVVSDATRTYITVERDGFKKLDEERIYRLITDIHYLIVDGCLKEATSPSMISGQFEEEIRENMTVFLSKS